MSDDPQRGNPLETAPIPTLLLRYSVPTALTLMVNFLYNIVDQIFIGRGVGISGMTATNIAFPLVILVGAVSLLLGDGCAAYVSLALGRRQQAEADAAVGQTVTLLLVSGIVLAALSALLAPQLVWLLGTTETAYAQSVAYLRTIAVGIPFQLLCPALTAIVRADGSPQYTMRCMLAGALLNVALDALFIFPLAMGVVGAGIATVIGEAVSALLFLRYLPHMKTVQVRRENLRPAAARTGRILALGLPSLLTQMMTAAVQIVMNNLMRKYGAATIYGSDITLSVYGMMLKIYQIAHAMFVGVSSATQPINGFNFGAQHYDRVYRTYRLATRAALVISVGWFAVFMLLPRQIGMLFAPDNPLYLDCTAHCFRRYMLAFFLYGAHMTTASFLQGIGKPSRSVLIPLARQGLFLIPLAFVLSARFGLDGALFAVPIADTMAFLLSMALAAAEFRAWRGKDWLA